MSAAAAPPRHVLTRPAVIHLMTRAEPLLAPICATALLLHPTPLTWPAALLGLAPTATRLIVTRRPWQPTPVDAPLLLLMLGGLLGYAFALDSLTAGIRLTGLLAAAIVFAWVREQVLTPARAERATVLVVGLLVLATVLLVHIAQPFLRLDRVPPLGWLAAFLEPWGLYRVLVADPGALQRYRWYASGAGALAAVGIGTVTGLGLAGLGLIGRRRDWLVGLVAAGLLFAGLLVAADNRGSMVAAALTVGLLIVLWRPKLTVAALLVVFGALDLIALGVVQRGLNLRTVVERLQFWENGLRLASEAVWTGVGLGTRSVELAYRTAFQPTYPPFSHTHNIFVQGLLEQGLLGLLGLLFLVPALARLAVRARQLPDERLRTTAFGAIGAILALLLAGLTEIVALTTLGGVLLFALLGLLVAATDGSPRAAPLGHQGDPVQHGWHASVRVREWLARGSRRPWTTGLSAGAVALILLLAAGVARPLIASPFLNAGSSALYRGTLAGGVSAAEKRSALADADYWLNVAQAIDADSVAAARNRALAAAAAGQRDAARTLADQALALTPRSDRHQLFGVGRAFVANDDWDHAITVWEQAGAGPQLYRLGQRLVERRDNADLQHGLRALAAAARAGAPGRIAQDTMVQALLARGAPLPDALASIWPLLYFGGDIEYQTRLEIARIYRTQGDFVQAESFLTWFSDRPADSQLPLERGLLLLARGESERAETLLREAVAMRDPALPLPAGDDPSYWLATAQARLGKHHEAVSTARAGLSALPAEQADLAGPFHLLIADSLLALGDPSEAVRVLEAGQRAAPNNAAVRQALGRAREAARSK
ncbi:MAG: tetratricopeptide repeat protein [Chloroflexi bacterium]|nr:tetratricopeptide repeat protein [Chloroflexota bacterium]